MSTNNITTMAPILPDRKSYSQVNTGSAATIGEAIPPVGNEQKKITAISENEPINQATENRNMENRKEKFDSLANELNLHSKKMGRKLQFTVSDALPLGRVAIKVIDSETDKVIREIPSEEALNIAQKLNEELNEESLSIEGLIFADKT